MSGLTKVIGDRLVSVHRRYGWRAEKESLFSPRRIDVLAISPGAGEVIGFEIKVSLQDFRNELRDPSKRLTVMRHCSQFYFVTPQSMLKATDIPEGCGLIHYHRHGWLLIVKASPQKRSELPVEIELRVARERWDAKKEAEARAEVDALQLVYEKNLAEKWEYDEQATEDEFECMTDLPHWMMPRFLKPLRFQFDVLAAASKLAVAVPLLPVCDFDEVPF